MQELRAQFLACREAWHGELVAELDDGGSPYDYLKRLTDVHRLHLFDVVMQYRAIFSDHSSAQVRQLRGSGKRSAMRSCGACGIVLKRGWGVWLILHIDYISTDHYWGASTLWPWQ